MKKNIAMILAGISIFALPMAAQAKNLTHYFEATRTQIKGEVYKQTSNVADAKTSNLSQNGQRVAVTIQAFSKEGNYDSGSYKRDDGGTAYVRSASSNINLWESAHSTSGTSDAWQWLHLYV